MTRFGHTLVRETTGHEGVPWWSDFPDHRRPGQDEWSGWDESAEEGPDEGPPYVGAGTGVPYDRYHDNPATGPYPGWPPTRAEPDPRDLLPSATWITVRKAAEAAPNPLLAGFGCGGCTQPGGGISGRIDCRPISTRVTSGYDLGGLGQDAASPMLKKTVLGLAVAATVGVLLFAPLLTDRRSSGESLWQRWTR
ncbi:MAG: hypothetical protein ACREKH_12260 [Candidatus Rokuibacteriota bacterium]